MDPKLIEFLKAPGLCDATEFIAKLKYLDVFLGSIVFFSKELSVLRFCQKKPRNRECYEEELELDFLQK